MKTRLPDGLRAVRSKLRSGDLLVVLAGLGLAVGVIPLASQTPLLAAALGALLLLVILVAAVGMERASTTMLVLAFFFAPLTNFQIAAKYIVAASVFLAVAFALALPSLLRRRLQLPPSFAIGSVLFVGMGLIAMVASKDPFTSLTYTLASAIAFVLIPIALVWMAPTDRQMYWMLIAFGAGAAASTLYGIPRNVYRNFGFTYHPVALAYTTMLVLSFVPYLLATRERSRWVLVPPVAVLALIGVWTSGSRTGLVVLVCLAILVPILERWTKVGLLVGAGFLLLIPYLVTYDASRDPTSALSRLLGQGGAANSDVTRLDTLREGIAQALTSPVIGNGYSTEVTYVIHNLYLQVLQAEGFLGLIGLLMMLWAFTGGLRTATLPRRCLAYPAIAAILAAPFQPNMGDHYLGLALGLALYAATRPADEVAADDDASGPELLRSPSAVPQATYR